MRRNIKHPKDGERQLRDTVKQLKGQISRLRKENDILRQEMQNMTKTPKMKRDKSIKTKEVEAEQPSEAQVLDQWRVEFAKKFKLKP